MIWYGAVFYIGNLAFYKNIYDTVITTTLSIMLLLIVNSG